MDYFSLGRDTRCNIPEHFLQQELLGVYDAAVLQCNMPIGAGLGADLPHGSGRRRHGLGRTSWLPRFPRGPCNSQRTLRGGIVSAVVARDHKFNIGWHGALPSNRRCGIVPVSLRPVLLVLRKPSRNVFWRKAHRRTTTLKLRRGGLE